MKTKPELRREKIAVELEAATRWAGITYEAALEDPDWLKKIVRVKPRQITTQILERCRQIRRERVLTQERVGVLTRTEMPLDARRKMFPDDGVAPEFRGMVGKINEVPARRYSQDLTGQLQGPSTVKPIVLKEEEPKPSTKGSMNILGLPVSSVLRWMGAKGWTFDQARAVCRSFGVEPTDSTIKGQMWFASTGRKGYPKLDSAQVASLSAQLPGSAGKPERSAPVAKPRKAAKKAVQSSAKKGKLAARPKPAGKKPKKKGRK